jgi:predicted transposase YbfD/YdcC
LKDRRIQRTKRHLLLDIVALSICAVIAGAEGWLDIERYGRAKRAFLSTFLALPHGIPSHDTIERVFRSLKPEEFHRCFESWMRALQAELGLQLVAIDGKTLRRSYDRANGQSALHLVSAWSVANQLSLGQVAVADKSNEITAIPALLELLELKGAVVTIDAMGCQKQIAAKIIEQKADYVLAVKDNQPTLHADLQEHFLQTHEMPDAKRPISQHHTKEKRHGRVTERFYYTTAVPATLRQREAWRGVRSVGQAITVTHHEGKEVFELRYYISSLPSGARRFVRCVRGHWGIENSLHWCLDVVFDEDRSRIRKDHGPENFALIRRLALSLLKQDKTKESVRGKRKIAAWDGQALLNILGAAN